MGKKQPKRGRPKKPAADGKTVLMQVRLSPVEKAVFVASAQVSGEELSVWVRQRLRRAARDEAKEGGRPDPFLAFQEQNPTP